jgi:hypothetical protein
MTFRVDDQSSSTSPQPAIWITLEEQADGTVKMSVHIEGSVLGDLRGIFFDVADESLIGSIQATSGSSVSSLTQGNDSVRDLGNGANMNGLLGSDGGYDVGIAIGSAGIGKDDIQSFSTVLSSTSRHLTLDDFANADFGVRTTSVGTAGHRGGSSKLLETTTPPIQANDDSAQVFEDQTANGQLLDNDLNGGSAFLTGWSGGDLGEDVTLANAEGATLRVDANGQYLVDATQADRLNAEDVLIYNFTYDARNQSGSTSWSTDTANFRVVVRGVNDAPDAQDDDLGSVLLGGTLTGNVSQWLANDTDIDRGDTPGFAGIQGADGNFHTTGTIDLGNGASIALETNGDYIYTPGSAGAWQYQYQTEDAHGATDVANLSVNVRSGVGGGSSQPANLFPPMTQALSNVVLYLDDGNTETDLIKVKITPADVQAIYDIDDLQLSQFLSAHQGDLAGNTQLVAVSIHAGQQYPNEADEDGTRPGEGTFFLLGDSTPITAVGLWDGGWTHDWSLDDFPLSDEARDLGLTPELLAAPVSQDYIFNGSL